MKKYMIIGIVSFILQVAIAVMIALENVFFGIAYSGLFILYCASVVQMVAIKQHAKIAFREGIKAGARVYVDALEDIEKGIPMKEAVNKAIDRRTKEYEQKK